MRDSGFYCKLMEFEGDILKQWRRPEDAKQLAKRRDQVTGVTALKSDLDGLEAGE